MTVRWHVHALGLLLLTLLTFAAIRSNVLLARDTVVTIVGSVVDASLNPLANVTVVLERGEQAIATTTSGQDGSFRLSNIVPGTYRMRASAKNMLAFSRTFSIAAAESTVRFPIVMTPPDASTKAQTMDAVGESQALAAMPMQPPPPGRGGSARATLQAPPAPAAPPRQNAAAPGPADSRERRVGTVHAGYRDANPTNYAHVEGSRFRWTRDEPLSTFGADVDTASYANVRRFLSQGQLPPSDAVRIEELVNYFRFDYARPRDGRPIALTTEMADCAWAPSHRLVLIGARAKARASREIGGRNIVLLVDVSGSMSPSERLPLLKSAFGMFVDTLRPDDRLAIVTYAGSSGVALPSTSARDRETIQRAIANLGAGGSTNGAQGLLTAYRVARQAYIPGGVNRVILATDGDFNVGVTSREDLLRLITREKDSGVFLSVLGVGTDNLKDATMEMLADKGNGNYAYLDSLQEAQRVLVHEGNSTLETVAKDVKFQVEFNPAFVSAWKLIGYENRVMAAEDFNDDRKDGGELGSDHTVTMLYEVVPVGGTIDEHEPNGRPIVDPLKYQQQPRSSAPSAAAARSGEWMTVKARYKTPEGEVSEVLSQPVRPGDRVVFLPFVSAVAEYGLLLRDDAGNVERWDALARRAHQLAVPVSLESDGDGFVQLVELAKGLARIDTRH